MVSLLELCLKNVRKAQKMTQKELCKKSGYSQSYISKLENDKNMNPTLEVITCLAKSLNVCPLSLLVHKTDSCNCKD